MAFKQNILFFGTTFLIIFFIIFHEREITKHLGEKKFIAFRFSSP